MQIFGKDNLAFIASILKRDPRDTLIRMIDLNKRIENKRPLWRAIDDEKLKILVEKFGT